MNVGVPLGKFLAAPPVKGGATPIVAIAAVAAPTVLRLVTDPSQGDGYCAFLPFVALAAVVLNWQAATAVAAVSGFLAAYLFEGTRFELFEVQCEITGIIYFYLASVLIIGLAEALRKTVADPLWLDAPDPKAKGLVFSRRAGQACVSWQGGRSFVPLGPADEVEAQMRDFIAQQEFGRRLTREDGGRGP